MSGRTKPRVQRKRPGRVNTLAHLLTHTGKLRPGEIEQLMAPKRAALQAAQTASLGQHGFFDLCTALHVSEAIESLRVVRGFAHDLAQARTVLDALAISMDPPTGWKPHALHWNELDALRALLRAHVFQLQQLQYNEYQAACRLAEARVASKGGLVVRQRGTT